MDGDSKGHRCSACRASVITSGEFGDPVLGIGDTIHVGRSRIDKPLQRLVGTLERQQRIGVDVEQPRRGLAGLGRIQLRGRENREGLFELPQVGTGPGDHDAKFVGIVAGERGGKLSRP